MQTKYVITYSVFKNCAVNIHTEKFSNEIEARAFLKQKKEEFQAIAGKYPGRFNMAME